MFRYLDGFKPYGHWLLRIALGGVFVIHGLGNLMDLAGFATAIGVPQAVALLIVLAEVAGGVLVLAGGNLGDRMTRLGALLLLPVLLVVMYAMHWKEMSFAFTKIPIVSGVESLLVLFLISLYMLLKGNKV